MKFKSIRSTSLLATAAFMALFVSTDSAYARNHHRDGECKILSQESLPNSQTADLFLRENREGRKFLYVASANGKLSIFDVTNPEEPRQVNSLSLSTARTSFHIRPINHQTAIATAAPDSEDGLTVLDLSNAPSAQMAKQLKGVDAYAIDSATNTLYVAQRGTLVVMRFDHPITREAEIWEESYEAR